MILGFANGCFDAGLHPGHRHLLTECQRRCDRLIVALNSDESVRALKGPDRPINPLELRAKDVLASLRPHDLVTVFESEEDLLELIRLNKPNIIFKGSDYEGNEVVGSDLAKVILIPRLAGFSTSSEIEKRRA